MLQIEDFARLSLKNYEQNNLSRCVFAADSDVLFIIHYLFKYP